MPPDNPTEQSSEPTIAWDTAPDQIREAYDRQRAAAEAHAAEAQAAKREIAMFRAGVDVDSPTGKLFARAYDGPIDDVEKVKTAWAEVAPSAPPVVEVPETPPNDGPTEAEAAFQASAAALRGGATPPGAEPVKPLIEDMYEGFHADRKKGVRREIAGAKALDKLIAAAANPNDPRHDQAIYDEQRWREEHR